jgi:hypothetical protein
MVRTVETFSNFLVKDFSFLFSLTLFFCGELLPSFSDEFLIHHSSQSVTFSSWHSLPKRIGPEILSGRPRSPKFIE